MGEVARLRSMWVGTALRGLPRLLRAGGTVGMFGTPVSVSQWLLINAVGATIILIAAVLPVATIPLWQSRQGRLVLLALCWVIAVGCGAEWIPYDRKALIREREIRPRSLVAGRDVYDQEVEDLSEP